MESSPPTGEGAQPEITEQIEQLEITQQTRRAESPLPGEKGAGIEAIQRARALLKDFERQNETRFRFERIIGQGSAGFTLKMIMNDNQGPSLIPRPIRRFVMKRALDDNGETKLISEIETIRVCPHHIYRGQNLKYI